MLWRRVFFILRTGSSRNDEGDINGFGGTENFELRTVTDPPIGRDTVRVKVAAAAFNPIDYQMRRGSTESKLLKSPILGREMGGTLTEVGELVTGFKIGDEVFGYVGSLASNGTYAEEVVVPASLIACIPRNLDFAGAAAIRMVGLTASQAVRRCPIKQGAKVFVAGGAGGVGSMVIRFLMLNGINNIFSTCGNRESRRRLNSMGLSEEKILDYCDAELAEKLKKAAGGSFDVCFDTVGGKMSECSAEIVRVNGIYVDITFLTTERARRALFDKACYGAERSEFRVRTPRKR